ncbi:MAG TPA: rhamnose ABC transporter substrate-binding protein, partial [Lachnospiraceae bacterium]|nr:rhamnose ABC transporter substrate-binding protein [Lachnospiraceae bacterium]
MKKFLALLLSLALMATLLVGCGGGEKETGKTGDTKKVEDTKKDDTKK